MSERCVDRQRVDRRHWSQILGTRSVASVTEDCLRTMWVEQNRPGSARVQTEHWWLHPSLLVGWLSPRA